MSQINLKNNEKNSKSKISADLYILSVTENGYGKRTSYSDYRVTNRGEKGLLE